MKKAPTPPLPINGPWTLAQQYLRPLDIRLLAAFDKGSQYIIQQNNTDKYLLLKVPCAISGYAGILLK